MVCHVCHKCQQNSLWVNELTYTLYNTELNVHLVEEEKPADWRQQVHYQVIVHHVLGIQLQPLNIVSSEVSLHLLNRWIYNYPKETRVIS